MTIPDHADRQTAASRPRAGQSYRLGPVSTALLWGDAAMIAAAGLTVLAALPFKPGPDHPNPWAELGWAIVTAGGAVILALVAGTVAVYVGLRRGGHRHQIATAVTLVPCALLLGAFTLGFGALAAPAVAVWIVNGLTARPGRAGRVALVTKPTRPPGEAAPGVGSSRWLREAVRAGLPQRLLVTLVLSTVVTFPLLFRVLGYRLGGHVAGEYLLFAACLPALVVIPFVLLRRVLPAWGVAATTAVMATVVAFLVPVAAADAHPSPARLTPIAAGVLVPVGHHVVERVDARIPDPHTPLHREPAPPVPVTMMLLAPTGSATSALGLPAELRPDTDGHLPDYQLPAAGRGVLRRALPASAAGVAVADRWEELLLADGWKVDEWSTPERRDASDGPYWLTGPARHLVHASGRLRYSKGPWVRADVVPHGDGAVLVVSARP